MAAITKTSGMMWVRVEAPVARLVRQSAKLNGRCLQREVNRSLAGFYRGISSQTAMQSTYPGQLDYIGQNQRAAYNPLVPSSQQPHP